MGKSMSKGSRGQDLFPENIFFQKPYGIIVSVLHQNEGGIGKSIPDAQEISRGRSPREISRVKGNLEGGGVDFPIPPEF